MESVYRIVNTLKNEELSKKDRCTYTLQFVEYVGTDEDGEPLEVVKNSIELKTGQIFRDALNMSEGKDENSFRTSQDTTFDYSRYVEFIREINKGLSREALQFCYKIYDEFYTTGKSADAYVPTMNVRMELDCTEDGYLVEYYYYEDFENLLVYDFYSAVKERIAIKKCALCGTYFVTQNRTDELYCSAACRNIISKQRSKIHHRLDDENELLKRRIASRLQQRTKVNNDALREDREAVHKRFLYDVKAWKKQIKEGTATAENYRLWLQTQDLKYATMLERREPLPAEVRPVPVIKAGNVVAEKPLKPILPQEAEALLAEEMPKPEKQLPDQLRMELPLEEQGVAPEIKNKILHSMEGKNSFAVRKAVFPNLDKEEIEGKIIGKSEPETVPETEPNKETETVRIEEQQSGEFKPYKALTIEDMKARLAEQKAALEAQGLDELMGLLEDENNR